jgi:predicted nucleic-acid-binding protein
MALIAADTNVLVRLLVEDDPGQAEKARALFDEADAAGDTIWIADIVLVELVWVLQRVFGRERRELAAAVKALAGHSTVAFESPAEVGSALPLFERGPCDFADALLATKAAAAGCASTRSFDKARRGLPGVKLL